MTRLTNSPADVLRWLIVQLGLGTNPDDDGSWPVYDSNEPSSPDDLIVVYDTAGEIQGREHHSGRSLEHYGAQIQVRGSSKAVAWAKVDALVQSLEESVKNTLVTVSTLTYIIHAVTRRSGPMLLGREPATSRVLYSLNVVFTVSQVS
jgi:hypothetical protein